MNRYSIIHEKNPREIVLLRGRGCRWRRCSFCDYHLDSSTDEKANFELNKEVLSQVTGIYQHLEVINSGSFPELDEQTMCELLAICRDQKIHTLHFECHYLYRKSIPALRDAFAKVGTDLKIKIGVESFHYEFREHFLKKGISEKNPETIAENFNECCLLFGLTGQTIDSMITDIETGLTYFERVCVNIFVENSSCIKPDKSVTRAFTEHVLPLYISNERVDILLNNTDFGVGE
ncbi:MAG: radical SAM protein [Lachnospiraceae bacterium]|nr:radical SAM protein [Lachnospiraceae bacterium]